MTGEPGAECPECRKRLEGGACTCGWRASSSTANVHCVDCYARSALQLDDDGALRCAACHVTYLRDRAALDPISVEELEQCRASIRASLARLAGRAGGADVDRVFEGPRGATRRVPSGEKTHGKTRGSELDPERLHDGRVSDAGGEGGVPDADAAEGAPGGIS